MAALLKSKVRRIRRGNQVDEGSKKKRITARQVETMSRQQVFIWNNMAIRYYSTIIAVA